jgi:hypothetical protein
MQASTELNLNSHQQQGLQSNPSHPIPFPLLSPGLGSCWAWGAEGRSLPKKAVSLSLCHCCRSVGMVTRWQWHNCHSLHRSRRTQHDYSQISLLLHSSYAPRNQNYRIRRLLRILLRSMTVSYGHATHFV